MQLQQINLEREKFAHAQKKDELNLGVKTIETYRKSRKKGVSKAIIVATFPQMQKTAEADKNSELYSEVDDVASEASSTI